jgi:hypothetical protein
MNFIKKLFGGNTLYDEVKKRADKIVVDGYRKVAIVRYGQMEKPAYSSVLVPPIAPSYLTTDWKILDIYRRVLTAYQKAASKRQEIIPAKTLNFIAFCHMQKYELEVFISNNSNGIEKGDKVQKEHLKSELQQYMQHGLNPKYIGREVDLINYTFH